VDWTIEAEREEVLNTWRENRGFDGTYISRDQEAWTELRQESQAEWEYKYENVLGGTGNTFGVELEVKFRSSSAKQAALQELYRTGITHTPSQQSYHSSGGGGMWKPERDGSLGDLGLELVSPVLKDDPKSWEHIQKAVEIMKRHGAYVDGDCGGHVHVGIQPLDHRTYSWQRLGRIAVGYEKQFYRMGGANSETYRTTGQRGVHKGTDYTKPLSRNFKILGSDAPATARGRFNHDTIDGRRYTFINTVNIDASSGYKPAVEMRYPNSTLDFRQIQAQVQVANAVVHQAAVIRNESPQNEFTPRFSETGQQLRVNTWVGDGTPQEEQNFRQFLDVLGNKEDRKAATWLWVRGRSI
jgi:hypothetical protein